MKDTGKAGVGTLAKLLASETRWRLLEELSKGGIFSVSELAAAAGVKQSAASLHMILLKKAGIAVQGKGRLYTLAPGLLAAEGGRDVALGRCTLHFGGGGE
jgi:DNA-binding transcriptional ArsR family regulator